MASLQILIIGLAYLCSCALGIQCPHGFEEYNHACYMVGEHQVDYLSAYKACAAVRGGFLLNVDATTELDFVKRLVGPVRQRVPGFWIDALYTAGAWNWSYRMLNSFDLELYLQDPSRKLGYICEAKAF